MRYHFIINGSDIAGADSPPRRHICMDGWGQVRSLDLPVRTVANCFVYLDQLLWYLLEGFILGWDIPWFVILFLLSSFVFLGWRFFFGFPIVCCWSLCCIFYFTKKTIIIIKYDAPLGWFKKLVPHVKCKLVRAWLGTF